MEKSKTTASIQFLIKALLKKHKFTYLDLANFLHVSEGTIKQLMNKGSFTTERLESIGQFFGLTLIEFLEMANKQISKPFEITLEQEEILFTYPISIKILFLFGVGFSLLKAKKSMNIEELRFNKALKVLDKAGLVEILPYGQIRVKARGPFRLNKNGPIEKSLRPRYIDLLKEQIIFGPAPDTYQRTFEMYFTESLFTQLKDDINKLLERYSHMTRLEAGSSDGVELFPVTGLMFLKPFDGWKELFQKNIETT